MKMSGLEERQFENQEREEGKHRCGGWGEQAPQVEKQWESGPEAC